MFQFTVSSVADASGRAFAGRTDQLTQSGRISLVGLLGKSIVIHSVTYFLIGALAVYVLDYFTLFERTAFNVMMRPLNDPWVMAGPLFQPLRGVLFGVVFYLLRDLFFERRNGWLLMWVTLAILGIFNTFGPTPGSVEGFIYTTFPWSIQLQGLPEVILQSFLLAVGLFYWVRHPEKKWLTWTLVAVFVLLMAMPLMGLLMLGIS